MTTKDQERQAIEKITQRHRKSSCMTITWKEIAKRRRTQYGKKTNESRGETA